MTRSFLIDTDTASDDAVAILMALRWPDVKVEAITVVAGNMRVDQGVSNALYTAELCGSDVPVYRGADRPLRRELYIADWFHGKDGLGDQGYPPPTKKPAPGHAVPAMIETIKAHPGLTLVTLGPLTNVALALAQAPEIAPLVGRCVIMGGAANVVGNVTPAAEYNMWVDPDAAQMVFRSGMAIEMVGWELNRFEANLRPDDIAYIKRIDTPLAHFTIDCNEVAMASNYKQSNEIGIALPDAVCMAIALDPATVVKRMSKHYVEVEADSELTRGMTVVDQLGVTHEHLNAPVWGPLTKKPPTTNVIWEIDIPRWKAMLYEVLR